MGFILSQSIIRQSVHIRISMGSLMNEHTLYTIGYSCHTLDSFIMVIKRYNINAIADVRSQPFSKYKPEFNSNTLSIALKGKGISYVFLGEECGARIKDITCYINGKADYSRIAASELFNKGLDRIVFGLSKFNIALLCAEKDHLMCHRTILICRNLRNRVFKINHILCTGQIETQAEAEKRLVSKLKLDIPNFLKPESQIIEEAYDLQGFAIAYDTTIKNKQEVAENG